MQQTEKLKALDAALTEDRERLRQRSRDETWRIPGRHEH